LVYKTINEIPQEYQFIIKKLIDNGIIATDKNREFYLTYEMLQIILMMVRAGIL